VQVKDPENDPNQGFALVFSDVIRTRRRDLGMSQRELARRLDVTPASVSYFESGQRVPSVTTFIKIKNILEWSTRDCLKVIGSLNECKE